MPYPELRSLRRCRESLFCSDHQSRPCAPSLEWGEDSETWESIHTICLSRKEITEMTRYLVFQSISSIGWNERLSRYALNHDESPNNEEHSRWRQAKNKALMTHMPKPEQFICYILHTLTHTHHMPFTTIGTGIYISEQNKQSLCSFELRFYWKRLTIFK